MKSLTILVLILFYSSLFAKECVVISGNKKDHNGVFTNTPILQGPTVVGDFKCKVFNSWVEADKYISKLPSGGELLVVQAAHGGAGGYAACNANDITGDQILEYLDKFTNRFKVGTIINSCYSGDLIKKKLIADAVQDKTAEKLQKLCIITTSAPGKVTYGKDILLDLTTKDLKNLDLENLLADYPSMYSTAAAWDSIGVTNYWNKNDQKLASKVLDNFSKLINDSQYYCNDNAKALTKICANPKVDEDLMADLVNYKQLEENQISLMKKDEEQLKISLSILEDKIKNKEKLSEMEQAKYNCLKPAADIIKNSYNVYRLQMFESLKWGLVKKFTYEEAPCLKWSRLKATNKEFDPFISIGSTTIIPAESPVLVDKSIDQFIAPNIISANWLKQRYMNDFEKKLGLNKVEQFDDPVTLAKNLSNSSVCKTVAGADYILAVILGDNSFYNAENELAPISANPYNLQQILNSFMSVSRQMSTMPAARDRARRSACADFKLKN